MSKRSKNHGTFMLTFGICAAIAGVGLVVLGCWEGVLGFLSGALVSYFGFKQINESKDT